MAFWRPFDTDNQQCEVNNISELNNEQNLNNKPELNNVSENEGWQFANHHLHIQSQQLVSNIYDCLKKENAEKSENFIINRICELTKLSHSTVYRIVKRDVIEPSAKRKRNAETSKNLDDFTKDVIRRVVYNFYGENKVPTLEAIQIKLQEYEDYRYSSLETLRSILIQCGFKYKKLDSRMIIMESPRIVLLRQEYLRKIREYRELGKTIIYLDETWYDTHDVVKYGWIDNSKNCTLNTPCSRGKRVIILHAGNENGFVPNALLLSAKNIKQSCADYHEDMTSTLFEEWFTNKLLPNISPNSVIVMDNASYHSRQLNKIPNLSTKKADILSFMRSKNLSIPEKIPVKKELLKIIKSKNFQRQYVIDNLAEQHGHVVLRLPPYYCVFNPIELIWANLKSHVRKLNQSPNLSSSILNNIRVVVNDLDETDVWKNSVAHVISQEKEYCILPNINPIIIDVGSDSSSDLNSD